MNRISGAAIKMKMKFGALSLPDGPVAIVLEIDSFNRNPLFIQPVEHRLSHDH